MDCLLYSCVWPPSQAPFAVQTGYFYSLGPQTTVSNKLLQTSGLSTSLLELSTGQSLALLQTPLTSFPSLFGHFTLLGSRLSEQEHPTPKLKGVIFI